MKTLLPLLALYLSGCVQVTHKSSKSPDGTITTETKYSSPAFGTKGIESADFQKGIVKGVASDQSRMTDVIGSAFSAGVAAGAKGTVVP
jgi:hypothetical protein